MPTRHRAPTVKQNLLGIMPELKALHIPVFISDDSVDDVTDKMLQELKKEYADIHYSHNIPPLGHDRNCAKTIALPETDYVWYLGDSAIINPGSLTRVCEIIEAGPSFIFLNREIPRLHLGPSGPVKDYASFMEHNLWHLTLTSATIYSREAIRDGLDGLDFAYSANFAQLGIILHAMEKGHRNLYWVGEQVMRANRAKTKSYWVKNTIPIFAHDWCNMVRHYQVLLPSGSLARVLKSHSKKTWILGPFNMHLLKKNGAAEPALVKEYWDDLVASSMLPEWYLRHYLK